MFTKTWSRRLKALLTFGLLVVALSYVYGYNLGSISKGYTVSKMIIFGTGDNNESSR